MAQPKAIRSPSGFNCKLNDEKLKQAIPDIAIKKPKKKYLPNFALLSMNLFKRATNRGAVDTIKLTFDALDIINALFSKTKYMLHHKNHKKPSTAQLLRK